MDDGSDHDHRRAQYSPSVSYPSSTWPRLAKLRESDLDPLYKESTWRRRGNQAHGGLMLLVLIPILLGSALAYHRSRVTGDDADTDTASAASPAPMALFWRDYRYFFTAAEDFSSWFADVEVTTRHIDEKWVALPHPTTAYEEADRERGRALIESRRTQIRLAQGEWDRFLEAHERLTGEIVESGVLWRDYVDGRPVDEMSRQRVEEAAAEMVKAKHPHPSPSGYGNVDVTVVRKTTSGREEKEVGGDEGEKKSFVALRAAARCVTEELVRLHAGLSGNWDSALMHLQAVQRTENQLFRLLRLQRPSWGSQAWPQRDKALAALEGRMKELRQRHESMRDALRWLEKKFPQEEVEAEKKTSRVAELKRARELLQMWATAVMDTHEGALIMIRRRNLQSRTPGPLRSSPASWEAWKSRNCGGTSCFDKASVTNKVKSLFFSGSSAAEVAKVARDEASWTKSLGGDGTPRIWRGVYEKACCERGMLAHRLKRVR